MIPEQNQPHPDTPSRRTLAWATGIALLVALVLLFTVVLPAEYGFDPLRTGAALKLTGIAMAEVNGRATPKPGQAVIYTSQPRIYKVESEDFRLTPGQAVEMKYHMQKGAVMVFSWKADGKLTYEFHGEPDQKPRKDYFESYALDDKIGKDAFYGSFTAPSTGIHGWFWQNKSKKDIDFHLTVAGFFDSVKMFAGDEPEEMRADDAR